MVPHALLIDADRLALDADFAREFRLLLTVRLAAIVIVTVVLAALRLVPWIAGGVATLLWLAAIGASTALQRRANRQLQSSPVIRLLRQTDSRPMDQ